jgi:FixJ family two-component response regulator
MSSQIDVCRPKTEVGAIGDMPVIYIVDDQVSFRAAMGRLLMAVGYKVLFFETAEDLLENLPLPVRGCILLDVKMPGRSGPELQDELVRLDYEMPIIFMSGHGDIPTSVRAIKAGAEDFLAKPASGETIIRTIERALHRYDESHERRSELKQLQARLDLLTRREYQVFALVVRGMLNKQIAFQLGTSERTIKAHRHSIMQKLSARSVAEIVSLAEKLGCLAPVRPVG